MFKFHRAAVLALVFNLTGIRYKSAILLITLNHFKHMYVFFLYGLHTVTHSFKVSKGAKIRNRYNQVPHLSQDTNEKVTNSQLDTTNESFPSR